MNQHPNCMYTPQFKNHLLNKHDRRPEFNFLNVIGMFEEKPSCMFRGSGVLVNIRSPANPGADLLT